MKIVQRRSLIKKMNKHSQGFTLTEVIVSLAILAMVSLGVGSVIKTIFTHQANIVNRTESNEFVGAISKWLSTNQGCSQSFIGLAQPTADEVEVAVKGYNGFGLNTSAGLDIGKGYNLNNKIYIRSLTMKDKGVTPSQLIISGTTYTRMIAQIKITFEERPAASATDSQKSRFIELPVLIDANKKIAQCQLDSSLADACTAMGGTFNATTGLCQPATNCQLRGTFIALTCSPTDYGCEKSFTGDYNNSLTGTASCPSGASPAISGRFIHTHTASCGKKCSATVTDQEDFYICLQCN